MTHTHTQCTQADIFFAGSSTKAASVSIMHSVPLISGRHMEMLAIVVLAANAYYVSAFLILCVYVCVRVCVCVIYIYTHTHTHAHTHTHTYIYISAVFAAQVCFLRLGSRVRVFLNMCPASSGVVYSCVLLRLVFFLSICLPMF